MRASQDTGFGSAFLIAAVVFLIVVIKNAWASDDAYIIFRSLEQLFAGHGPVWNPDERVQAFTSPLWYWLLAIPRIVSHDVYANAIAVSVVLAGVLLVVLRRALHDATRFVIAVLLLICCNGFMDFTTSGLENVLAYVLIAFYLLEYLSLFAERESERARRLPRLSLVFGLLLVTRLDFVFLVLPSFLQAVLAARRELDRRAWMRVIVASCGPLAVWSLFALAYYGTVVPNSALAKLNTEIARADLARQGVRYIVASLRYDTIAVVVLAAALAAPLVTRHRWGRGLALGVLANLVYVVMVGGDFMLGRFLSYAYLVSVVVVVASVNVRRVPKMAMAAAAVLIVYAFAYPHTPVKTRRSYSNTRQVAGIADERGVYFNATSIYKYADHIGRRQTPYFPNHASARRGYEIGRGKARLTDTKMIGFFGYWCGTRMMIVDRLGLADPLFARLPVADRSSWRIGHFFRAPVPGYYESLAHDTAEIKDPDLNEFYRKIRIVTRGPIWSSERWRTIVALNAGKSPPR